MRGLPSVAERFLTGEVVGAITSPARALLDTLAGGGLPSREALAAFLDACCAPGDEAEALRAELRERAVQTAVARFGRRIYLRGLVEFTNICRNDCRYCGIRRSNTMAARYRMTPAEILECCAQGWALGFRTFVLQGGEDPFFTDEVLASLVKDIKTAWPDCAVTLSVGERSAASYALLRRAGADRYLLRHETANPEHYARLHPPEQSLAARMRCLEDLKAVGFQTGAGLMVGSPWQSTMHLAEDLAFFHRFRPEMAGIGPFLPHGQTPFASFPAGDVRRTLVMLSLTRIMLPGVLLPATTALGTAAGDGRERGILAGANVLMPNLSPRSNRKKYMLYDGKISDGDEAAENVASLSRRLAAIGYEISPERGDYRA